MVFIKLIRESFRMAASQLASNKLRSFLSLLGISIGVFCIIAVLSAVDSLEKSILNGFSELGSNVVYIDKQPWTEDPGANYWKYLKRPNPTLKDYENIKERADLAEYVAYCYFTGAGALKTDDSSVEGAFAMGSTLEYANINGLELEAGRLHNIYEHQGAANVIVLGNTIKQELFGERDAVGKDIKMYGQKWQVIGVLEAEGENPFNFMNFDEVAWVPINTMRKFYNVGRAFGNQNGGQLLVAQVKEPYSLEDLKSELTGIIRANRRLRPTEDDNFALNEVSMLADAIGGIFSAMNLAGGIIGLFSLIVGMISVANIMFVSVKERTGLIGVKKALGARRNFILTEFLLEAIFLCIVGGFVGLFFVYLLLKGISAVIPFDMWLSPANAMIGVGVSIFVGIIAGIIPAFLASKMDPVEAMRG